ncbi:AAA family ATPase [Dehalobacterium formicoaceticum]|uniref:AAA family ATPase n=1 Tax=Dehalobacterium formicoaceticum TaxID=51515 RepID=UPI0031F6D488
MIITEIRCSNFFRFYGESIIECVVEPGHNVTVIRGENGTGKTTMLNAFYYCLYGDVTPPLYLSSMLNELVEYELKEGEETTAGVEICFEDKGVTYRVVRRRNFQKREGVVHQVGDEEFFITYKNPRTGNDSRITESSFIEGIIPSKLRGFFFFDGERIDRLAKIDGREEIKQAILDILGLTTLESLKDYFQKIDSELAREQKKYLSESGQDLVDEYEALQEKREKKNAELSSVKESIKKANENILRIREFLQNYNSASIKALENERSALENNISLLDKDIAQKKRDLLALTTRDFKNLLMFPSFSDIINYLENKRKKGELPSDVKEQFINDLLERHTCICGRDLVEGTEPYQSVSAMKSVAGRTELDDAYHKITAYMKQQQEQVPDFFTKYHGIQDELIQLEQQRDKAQQRATDIGKELRHSKIEEIQQKETERDALAEDVSRYEKQVIRIEVDLEGLERQIDAKNREIQDSQVRGEKGEAVKLWREEILKLGQLNQEFRTYFMNSTRVNLDERIREVFNTMKEKSYRYARLTDDFVLEITNDLDDEDDRRVLSTGEGQVASLAFIASLVSYAREKQQDKLMSDFSGGDFPIVMDSPFGNLSVGHKQNVAREIGSLASQVIVIVSDEQWSTTVEQNIMPRVSTIYIMRDGNRADQNVGEHTAIRRQSNG